MLRLYEISFIYNTFMVKVIWYILICVMATCVTTNLLHLFDNGILIITIYWMQTNQVANVILLSFAYEQPQMFENMECFQKKRCSIHVWVRFTDGFASSYMLWLGSHLSEAKVTFFSYSTVPLLCGKSHWIWYDMIFIVTW